MHTNIQNLFLDNCSNASGYLSNAAGEFALPVTVINGARPGKTILLMAGIHGCEYAGIQTVIELAYEIDPAEVTGRIVIAHPANPAAFLGRMGIPSEEQDAGCAFPGLPDGNYADRLAYLITDQLIEEAAVDFCIDLHGAGLHEDCVPYVRCPADCRADILRAETEAAAVLSVPYRVSSAHPGSACGWASRHGIPAIQIERGGRGLWSREEVDAYKRDVLALFAHLGVMAAPAAELHPPVELPTVRRLDSAYSGWWYPAVRPGQIVAAGQKLGETRDCFGLLQHSYTAESDGIVLRTTTSLAINKGDSLLTYGGK